MIDPDRVTGSLIGMAVGDVLGCPVESMSPARIRERFGRLDDLVEIPVERLGDMHFWRLPGLHSDDTQQALSIADVLIANRVLAENALFDIWKEMAEAVILAPSAKTGRVKKCKEGFGAHRGTGREFRTRIRHLDKPAPPSNGDGAAMRVAPIGLWFCRDREQRIDSALRSALMTSSHPHAPASAAAITAAVAFAMREGPGRSKQVIEEVASETRTAESRLAQRFHHQLHPEYKGCIHEISSALFHLGEWQSLPLAEALDRIAEKAEGRLGLSNIFATKSFALTAVPTAVLVAARNFDNFSEGVIETINLGGDTDTIGAMVGAILGAGNGIEAVPDRWQQHLLAHEQIMLRCQALATGKKAINWIPLPDLEKELTTLEAGTRSKLRAELIKKGLPQ